MIAGSPIIAVSAACATVRDETCPTKAHWVSQEMVLAIVDAGGSPVVVPVGLPDLAAAALMNTARALVLTGGDDVSFPGAPHRAERADAIRDRSDHSLFRLARKRHLPVVGICRGMQLIVFTTGGELGKVAGHASQPDMSSGRHGIEVSRQSRLGSVLGPGPISVTSLHQYAVQQTGEYRPVAWSTDGVIEAVEHPHRWELGVQWHPELDPTPLAEALFRALIDAASQ